ncbi:UDP-N-acetylglucosamine 2-epimerase [Peptostreptococcus russellii]|uniref:UDP-N-acetylglucosamine 2-epimerase (non-hydrolyzing) n=1 Tax=Peptostreptococcus russellii TaxID=215200 RepID=A0A2P7Q105_9FIRM|nr:UDP-N-acetylglucosamine 2-epimerase (non-hydrolyzing) [Peptostreptococcus russellii]PSJ31620.1 UDP-N-acetylglucosamine 2-epimerase [Peptostreptococcus russellii]
MKKIMLVFGTRPEAIKMAPLVKELEKRDGIKTLVCVTAQHREMLDQVLEIFNIVPDYDLDIMKESQTLSYITSSILAKIDEIMKKELPDIVVVHGDTTTTFATSLAAFYNKIKIAHVEAGLRTYKKYSPYPEEINRQMVSLVSDYNFAPTELTADNLIKEGKDASSIFITGNTAIDTLSYTVNENYEDDNTKWVGDSRLILLTVHRRENIGKSMEDIFDAVKDIVEKFDDIKVIYPLHKNPEVRKYARKYFEGMERVRLIEPLDVIKFHNLINKSYLIMTDSGGIQEEAPALGKPVLVLRNDTERKEGVESGTLILLGTDKNNIFKNTCEILEDENIYQEIAQSKNPYGDGRASKKIADILQREDI